MFKIGHILKFKSKWMVRFVTSKETHHSVMGNKEFPNNYILNMKITKK